MTVDIRAATAGDAEAIAFLVWQGWRTTYSTFIPAELVERRTLARRLREWRDHLRQPMIVFVAVDERGVVRGFVEAHLPQADPLRLPPDPTWQLEIGFLYVDPAAQGRGLGRALVAAVAAEARRRDLRCCLVVAFAGNPFHEAYARMGARLIATREFVLEGWSGADVYYVWDDLPATFGV